MEPAPRNGIFRQWDVSTTAICLPFMGVRVRVWGGVRSMVRFRASVMVRARVGVRVRVTKQSLPTWHRRKVQYVSNIFDTTGNKLTGI